MAGNIVSHGFKKDRKSHSVDLRISLKEQNMILRIKDDCIPFNPSERRKISNPDDVTENIGIRMVFSLAKDVQYQNILGMNALTIVL
jgi:anti-sigma regulatory factor (Ser/Thr protein kinase)